MNFFFKDTPYVSGWVGHKQRVMKFLLMLFYNLILKKKEKDEREEIKGLMNCWTSTKI